MQLQDLFDTSLIGRGAAAALDYENADGSIATLCFAELESRSNQVADVFQEWGIASGDRVGVFLPNRVEFIDVFLACIKRGIIVVPINVLYRDREITHILSDAQPRIIVTTPELKRFLPEDVPTADINKIGELASGRRVERVRVEFDGDHPAVLVYTSGTTGKAKGAILTHNNLAANAVNLLACWQITKSDRYLAVLPLFHVHGLGNGVHTWLASGCRMRLVERFEAARALELFQSFKPTLFFGVPTIYVRLLELNSDASREIGKTMRLFVSGSAPLPANIMESFHDEFGHVILERYGMSETLMNIGSPYHGERRPGSVGLPFPGVSIKLLDDQSRPVPAGQVGEVYVAGPNVSPGYWNNPKATAQSFITIQNAAGRPETWFRTGDLGEQAPDGYFTLRGRRTDLIISGGFNIYPREIEELLLDQPGVREAVVCGVSDPRRGEVPVAYVVTDEPFSPTSLEAACRRSLASFKLPREFVRVDALPRTALGKVQKHLLPLLDLSQDRE